MKYNDLIKDIEGLKEWIIEIRRDFHMNPELSTEEFRTKERIIEYLKELNIPYREFPDHQGIEALIEGDMEGPTVALRADMDALPLTDIKDVPYRSKVLGKMHACGHDGHMAIQLGSAKILKMNSHLLKGNVKLIFQPAEETVGGAKPMIEEGALDNPKVDMIFGLHITPELKTGTIGVRYGQMNASSDSIRLQIKGKSSHGAYPQDGTDAIVIAAHFITALQTIVSRNTDPREAAVITIGTIKGGKLANIISDTVELTGTIRTLNEAVRGKTLERLQQLLEGITSSMRGTFSLELQPGYPALQNHGIAVDIVKQNGIELLGEDKVIVIDKASLGVEDFGYFLQATKGAFFRLGSGNLEKNTIHPGHNNQFDIDEDCLVIGVMLQVMNAIRYLNNNNNEFR